MEQNGSNDKEEKPKMIITVILLEKNKICCS